MGKSIRPTWISFLLLLLLPLSCASGESDLYQISFETSPAVALQVEIAATPSARQQGLMERETLEENRGMLFVFPQEQTLQFWMKNTSIPLSIAYIDGQGIIRTIKDMVPFDLSPVSSDHPVQYALEVNRGWFARNDIRVGTRIHFPEPPPRAQL